MGEIPIPTLEALFTYDRTSEMQLMAVLCVAADEVLSTVD